MELYLLRHGIAIDRSDPACPGEADRFLTDLGRERIGHVAEAMQRAGLPLDRILASPWLRARQTASIVAEAYDIEQVEYLDSLLPFGQPVDLLRTLSGLRGKANAVLVAGHEPHLSGTLSWLISGRSLPVEIKKGSLAQLSVERFDFAPAAKLRWLLTPKLARRLIGKEHA